MINIVTLFHPTFQKNAIRLKGNSKFAKFVLNVSEWCVCAVRDCWLLSMKNEWLDRWMDGTCLCDFHSCLSFMHICPCVFGTIYHKLRRSNFVCKSHFCPLPTTAAMVPPGVSECNYYLFKLGLFLPADDCSSRMFPACPTGYTTSWASYGWRDCQSHRPPRRTGSPSRFRGGCWSSGSEWSWGPPWGSAVLFEKWRLQPTQGHWGDRRGNWKSWAWK